MKHINTIFFFSIGLSVIICLSLLINTQEYKAEKKAAIVTQPILVGEKSKSDKTTETDLKNSSWYKQVTEQIQKDEYNITFAESYRTYQSPNRAQNLRFIYRKDGFTAKPRQTNILLFDISDRNIKEEDKQYKTIDDWEIDFTIKGIGRKEMLTPFTGKELKADKNEAEIEDEEMKVTYKNTEEGMRQDFILMSKPEGKGNVRLTLAIETPLKVRVGGDALAFIGEGGEEKMKYSRLKVWDANGKILPAHFEKEELKNIALVVNDNEAEYPITIDPLSTSPNWTAESNQADADFGNSVSTAGDVNGDGYSDVIVGAYYYDNGQSNEGRAFVYYGSASGLSTTADWTAESNQASAQFGYSVSTAGDVNGDGYSDVIVGASGYDNVEGDEGAAFVYYGGTSGLSTTANWTAESNQASAQFGYSVSTAGDVNGDGFSDVIVGAFYYDNGQINEGRAFVYLGSSSGLSTTANWTAESNQSSALFGCSVSTAGDVNGDGYSDVIVGAYGYDGGQTNEGRAFVYLGSSSGLSTTENWSGESNQAYAYFGISVSTAGDVNGDGYSDVIVGAYGYDGGQTNEGRAYVYLGSSSGLSTTANWTAESNQASANYGYSVSTAGDVNGDGYSDVIVGAYKFDGGETDEGRAFVYLGSSSGLSTTENWSGESNQAYAYFGISVSTAGDVNGDGYSDVIVGAYGYDGGQTNEGRAYVYLGSSSGLSTTANWTAESNQASANYGYSVSTAGDVNGDGYSDVIVGAYYYDNGQSNEGRAFVYYGSASGLSTTADWTAESNQASAQFGYSVSTAGDVNGDGFSDVIVGAMLYDVVSNEGRAYVYLGSSSGLSATADWTAESNQVSAYFGVSVSTAGDVNGDGYSDVIVGADGYDNGQSEEGKAFVYYGSASGLSATANWTAESNQAYAYFGLPVATAGDVNGDGYSDVIVGAPYYDIGESNEGWAFVYHGSSSGLSATANWTAESNQVNAEFGCSVSTAGDVNGDGYSDVIVGAYYYDNGQSDEGRAFVYLGSSSGLSTTANWTAESNQASAYFGYSVSTAGDVNGDGYSDVIVGAYKFDGGETDEGRAYVYHGSSSGLSTTADWTAESNQVDANFGYSVSTAGDVNGDGYSDIIVGAYKFDGGETDEGKVFVYYGNGGTGLRASVQQYQVNSSTIIGPHGSVSTDGQIRFSNYSKSPFGRADGKLVYEYKTTGTAFSGSPITNSVSSTGKHATFVDLGLGTVLNEDLTGIPTYNNYRWRVRIEYDKVTNPYQVYSPWKYYENYQPKSYGSFKSQNAPLPVELVSFSASYVEGKVLLNWQTATEVNNYGFEIERTSPRPSPQGEGGEAGRGWEKIGFVEGHGNSNSPKNYSFEDKSVESGKYSYRLKQIDIDGGFRYSQEVEVKVEAIPTEFALFQNYPNPFNPSTTIKYSIPKIINNQSSIINLKVYDLLGSEVATLVNEQKKPGFYSVEWNASNIASGIYFYRIQAEGFIQTKKLILLR